MHGFRSICSADEAIARVASRSGGVIDRLQLEALGLARGAIEHRLAMGRLRRLHHGVYAVGHEALQLRGRLVGALLVGGPGAALSHRTAAGLTKLIPSMPKFVEITTTSTWPRSRPGLAFHHSMQLDAHMLHDLPVTTPIRTLLDLAATLASADLERACSEALVLDLVTAEQLARQHGRGSGALRAIVAHGIAPTRSELERGFLRAMAKAGIPRPETNARIGRHRVDFHWPEHRLVVELDGWRFHGHRLAFERDRVRDVELQLRGWTVARFTWRRLREEPDAVAGRVALLLSGPATRRAS